MDFTDEQKTVLALEKAKTDSEVNAKTSKFFDKVIREVGLKGMSRQVLMLSEPVGIDITLRVPISAFTDHKVLCQIEEKLSEEWGVPVYLITRTK
jgi:hypothetical protein